MSMDIYSEKGTKVVYTGQGGYDSDKEHAKKYLTEGSLYTIHSTDVGSWHTWIQLEEFPGKTFNSVMFDNL